MRDEERLPLTLEHVRVWLLLILRSATVAGLLPLTSQMLHRLVFLSNTLAGLYETNPPSDFVLKHKRGPYYPQAQFELERMAAMGLVDLSELRWVKDADVVDAQVSFAVSEAGRTLTRSWITQIEWCRSVDSFLTDLCAAVANIDDGHEVASADHDLTYNQGWAQQYSVIAFRRRDERLSERGAQEIAALLPKGLSLTRQHQLRLYLKYLERLAA